MRAFVDSVLSQIIDMYVYLLGIFFSSGFGVEKLQIFMPNKFVSTQRDQSEGSKNTDFEL